MLHAVLALGSAHKREMLNSNGREIRERVAGKQEQSTLQQYNKVISYLQPHFSAKNKESIRIALITCMIFVYLEFLRGRYEAGNIHL